jgi:hypothetical protein
LDLLPADDAIVANTRAKIVLADFSHASSACTGNRGGSARWITVSIMLAMRSAAAQNTATTSRRLVTTEMTADDTNYLPDGRKRREVLRSEGRFLPHIIMSDADSALLCEHYLQLLDVDEALGTLMAIRRFDRSIDQRTSPRDWVCVDY